MRQRNPYDANDANESTRRLVKDGMSTGLTNKDTAHGFSVLYQVFGRKQCSLCSALRHKRVTLQCLRDSFCLGTFVHGFIPLPPRSLASSRGCSFEIIEPREYSKESNHYEMKPRFQSYESFFFFLILANCVDSMLFHCFYYS